MTAFQSGWRSFSLCHPISLCIRAVRRLYSRGRLFIVQNLGDIGFGRYHAWLSGFGIGGDGRRRYWHFRCDPLYNPERAGRSRKAAGMLHLHGPADAAGAALTIIIGQAVTMLASLIFFAVEKSRMQFPAFGELRRLWQRCCF